MYFFIDWILFHEINLLLQNMKYLICKWDFICQNRKSSFLNGHVWLVHSLATSRSGATVLTTGNDGCQRKNPLIHLYVIKRHCRFVDMLWYYLLKDWRSKKRTMNALNVIAGAMFLAADIFAISSLAIPEWIKSSVGGKWNSLHDLSNCYWKK